MLCYQDLLDSSYSLKDFSRFCGVSLDVVKKWKTRGIPKKFELILSSKINQDVTQKSKNVTETPKNVTSAYDSYFYDNAIKNNNIELDKSFDSPLLNLAKSHVKNEAKKSTFFFKNLMPFVKEKITVSDKKLLSSDGNRKTYVDESGELFDFVKKGRSLFYCPSTDFLLCERFHLQSVVRDILNKHRTGDCLIKRVGDVLIHKSIENGSTFFSGFLLAQMSGFALSVPRRYQKGGK